MEGGTREGGQRDGQRFNEPHGCAPAHLPRYLPPEPAMTACCLGAQVPQECELALTTPCGTGGGGLAKWIKETGCLEGCLTAFAQQGRDGSEQKVVCMWYRYRDPGWVECQRAVAFPLHLHLHPALALRLSLLANVAYTGAELSMCD